MAWLGATAVLALGQASPAAAAHPGPAATYEAECGSCHVAYPARFLASADWSRVLGRLDRHYGVDASLDASTLAAVADHLHTAPATGASSAATQPLPRITTSRWFRSEHDELAAGTWTLPTVKSAANCTACHAGAGRGDFNEHAVRLPGGVQRNEGVEGEHEHED